MKRVFAFIGFSFAITLILLNSLSFEYSKFILISAVVLFIISLLIKRIRQAFVVPIVFGCAVFACLIFMLVNVSSVLPQQSLDGEYVKASFQIVDIPNETDGGYSYIVKTKSIEKDGAVQNIKLRVKTKAKINADYYDTVTGYLSIRKIADNGFTSYGYFGDGIFLTSSAQNCTVEKNENKPVNYYIIKCREYIKNNLHSLLDGESCALATALLIGDRQGLSAKTISNFNISGTAHIMAVSGLHTAVICYGFYCLLKRLGADVYTRSVLSVLLIAFYIGLADFSKSVIRSAIMLLVMIFAKMINKKSDVLNSLGFAVFLICLNPFAVTDAGALLTVCSVLGILTIFPAFNAHCPENKLLSYLYKSFFISISVVISTLPVMWLLFKTVTIIGAFLNFIMIPLAQATMVLSLILVMLSGIGFLAFIPKYLCLFSTKAILFLAQFGAEKLSFGFKSIYGELFAIAIALILLFAGLSLLINKAINQKVTAIFCIAVFLLASVLNTYCASNQTYLYLSSTGSIFIYNTETAVVIDAQNDSDFYTFSSILDRNNIKNALSVNSSGFFDDLTDSDIQITDTDNNDNFNIDLSDSIIVKCNGNDITAKIYDSLVTITDDCVIVGDYTALRNVYDKFSDDSNIIITFADNSQAIVRKESVWLK
ncbi:MAG: ComEC/Rec2 family competence protein [Eubacterium sp.]